MAARDTSVSWLALSAMLLAGCEPSHEELVAEHSSVVRGFCLDCHNDVERIADLSLESLDMTAVADRP
ncbi:MAG TPA: hypothetical protein VIM81_13280, partial [Gammaproteobacteria bacterium]